jgi:competence protein ComEC
LTLDRATLVRTGGVRVTFATGRVATVRAVGDAHPWLVGGEHEARQAAKALPMLAGWLSMLPVERSDQKRWSLAAPSAGGWQCDR